MRSWTEHDFVLQVLVSAFFGILFLQSGLDKVVDRAGNLEFLKGHFKNTPVASLVPMMVLALTVLELASGALCALGTAVLLSGGSSLVSYLGSICCGLTFLALFFGQRVAKDYAGAAALAPYFLVSMAAVYITRLPPSM
jgi:hypothetical protein